MSEAIRSYPNSGDLAPPVLAVPEGGYALLCAWHLKTLETSIVGTIPRSSRKEKGLTQALVAPAARLVVIEDNGGDVFLLERALKKQDFRFELIHLLDGGEALAFIRRQGAYADAAIPNLILLDLNLSKYTGEDLLREIRSAKHLARVPVCVWSSSQSQRDQAVLTDLGVARFITKPSGLDQFMEIGRIIKDLVS
jgi:CheY-like chemotaxis protein